MLNLPANVYHLYGIFLTQIVSGSQALPQREPRQRRSEGTSGGSGAAGGGGSGGVGGGSAAGGGGGSNRQQTQQYNNKDFSKKGGGSGTSGGGMGGGGGGGPMSGGRGGGETLPDTWQLFVGGLPQQTLDTDIRAVFEREGTILDVRVNPKNFAFVIFDGPEPVQRIMANREQFHMNGRRLNIELKRPSAMRYSGPRSGGGGGGGDRGDRDRGDRQRPSGGLGGGAGGGGGGGFGGKPRNKGGKR